MSFTHGSAALLLTEHLPQLQNLDLRDDCYEGVSAATVVAILTSTTSTSQALQQLHLRGALSWEDANIPIQVRV
jgi:hypothetical protein